MLLTVKQEAKVCNQPFPGPERLRKVQCWAKPAASPASMLSLSSTHLRVHEHVRCTAEQLDFPSRGGFPLYKWGSKHTFYATSSDAPSSSPFSFHTHTRARAHAHTARFTYGTIHPLV